MQMEFEWQCDENLVSGGQQPRRGEVTIYLLIHQRGSIPL